MRPAIFIDRDDTLILNRSVTASSAHPGSLYDPGLVQLLPGAAEACAEFCRLGYFLVVVTNQGCVARGECTLEQVDATNQRVRELVHERAQVELDGVYVCPYHPKGHIAPWNVEHPWRKPGAGMLLQAQQDLRIDLRGSWMIGDGVRDVEAGLAAGLDHARCLLFQSDDASERFRVCAGWDDAKRIVQQES